MPHPDDCMCYGCTVARQGDGPLPVDNGPPHHADKVELPPWAPPGKSPPEYLGHAVPRLRGVPEVQTFGPVSSSPVPVPAAPGTKLDAGKTRWSLIPWEALARVAEVLDTALRSGKYTENGWKLVPGARRRYLEACLRHVIARVGGELDDPDDKLPHLAHAGCCILFVLWFDADPSRERSADDVR